MHDSVFEYSIVACVAVSVYYWSAMTNWKVDRSLISLKDTGLSISSIRSLYVDTRVSSTISPLWRAGEARLESIDN